MRITHSIEIWREIALPGNEAVSAPAGGDDLPTRQDLDDLVVELARRYPALSRELAEYLAR